MFHNAIIWVGSFNDERYFYILSFDRKSENEAKFEKSWRPKSLFDRISETKDTSLLLRR